MIVGVLAQYMRFPHLAGQFSWSAFSVAAVVSIAAAIAGSLLAVRRAVRLSPAVAMQPPTPTTFRRGVVERLGVWRVLDQPTRIIVRNLERFPARSVLTIVGLSVSVSLLVGSQFLFGSIGDIIDRAYYRERRWTDEVAFSEDRRFTPSRRSPAFPPSCASSLSAPCLGGCWHMATTNGRPSLASTTMHNWLIPWTREGSGSHW